LLKTLKARDNVNDDRLKLIRDAHNTKKEEEEQHTDRMEDYLEVIYELIQQKGYATAVDISESLNVSSPSVTRMLRRLDDSSYLRYEKYRGICLTQHGINVAKNMHEKHGLLADFLKMIGVDENTANIDAEGIEHHIHPATLEKLERFVKIVKSSAEFSVMRDPKIHPDRSSSP